MDALLSIQEVADFLGVPVKTVYAWRHRNEGPPGFKVGRHVRFDRDAVMAWLEDRADGRPAA